MGSKEGRRVILVDDDASMSSALARVLRLAGYVPAIFSSAEAVLGSEDARHADCLVFDVHLPGLSGFELYEKLRCEGPLPPVIFITAYDEPESRALADAASAAAYLAKPFSGNDLMSAIARAIRARIEGQSAH